MLKYAIKKGCLFDMEFYAHKMNGIDKEKSQLLRNHLETVALQTSFFAGKFNQNKMGYVAGLLHDLGKYSTSFQNKFDDIYQNSEQSFMGAVASRKLYGKVGECVLSYSIASLNGKILDSEELHKKLETGVDDFDSYKRDFDNLIKQEELQKDLEGFIAQGSNNLGYSFSFLSRMIYSCLVDADFMDVSDYQRQLLGKEIDNEQYDSLSVLKTNLEKYVSNCGDKINKELLDECIKKSCFEKGAYSLSVQNYFNKIISSFLFGLNHAIKNNQDRIIYVIPYKSMIEQVGYFLKNIFGNKNVLEYHHEYLYEKKYDEKEVSKLFYETENFDKPIIIVDNFQFFKSLYSNVKTRCRKLHNIANSFIIADEPYMIPNEFLNPCVVCVEELITNYNVSSLFTTSGCCSFNYKMKKVMPLKVLLNERKYFNDFNVEIKNVDSSEELFLKIKKTKNSLIIANDYDTALDLYKKCGGERSNIYFISEYMIPKDRLRKINEIRCKLSDNIDGVRVFSTGLFDFGIDIKFDAVFREIIGMEQLIQNVLKCNNFDNFYVYDFSLDFSYYNYELKKEISKKVLLNNKNVLNINSINEYFEVLFGIGDINFDIGGVLKNFVLDFSAKESFNFNKVSNNFASKEDENIPLIISFDENCERLIQKLKSYDNSHYILRELQEYSVRLSKKDFNYLVENNKVENIDNIAYLLCDKSKYNNEIGLKIY
ncbi:MAG: hypothetical protein BWY78_01127 [Alphaproteobacteria bacterium ADurb.Bin438]|nr:MAG: hypothetical protein BWY78_01127 [Alphaproteobacteria bacterium ADurb.Bin438]